LQNPLYILLNLCRVAAYIKDGLVLSKEAGGEWGLTNLPSNYHSLLQEGLDCYHSDRQMENASDLAVAFSRFMIAEIMSDRR
jgi:streptomycin 3"-adenylyltransferase